MADMVQATVTIQRAFRRYKLMKGEKYPKAKKDIIKKDKTYHQVKFLTVNFKLI